MTTEKGTGKARTDYRVEMDGDMWMATGPGFINLEESDAAFAKTPIEAFNKLIARNDENKPRLTWEETSAIYDLVDRIREGDGKPYGLEQPILSGVEAQELISTAVAGFLASRTSDVVTMMNNLHGEIMNIQVNKRDQNKAIDEAMKTHRTYNDILVAIYARGHRDARHAAAELSLKDGQNGAQ